MAASETKVLGGCLGIAGALAAISMPFHPNELMPGALVDPRWIPVHTALLASFTLSIPGLVGLWLVQRPRLRPWAHAAFLLALVGSTLSVGMVALEVGALPGIARTDARPLLELIGPDTNYWAAGALFGTGFLTWIPGWAAVGVATATGGVLPRGLGAAIAVSTVAVAVPIHFVGGAGPIVHAFTGGAFGVAWLIAGIATFRGGMEGGTMRQIRAA